MSSKSFGQIDMKDLWTIPNLITYFRILCVPVFVAIMALAGIRADDTLLYIALGVFFVAASSDLVDGWIARKFNMQSGIGMVLDPLADKIMHISVLLCLSLCTGLTPLGQANLDVIGNPWYVHYGFVVLLLAKELMMVCIAPIVTKKGATVKANWLGKVSSATVSLGILLSFFHPQIYFADWGILAWGILMSYAAGVSYFITIMREIQKINKGEMKAATADSVKEEDIKIVAAKNGKTTDEE
ncbi:MAG: CDP-alcohol phosphatidyltransferase family protein [Clostridia bacterium]